jgi:hypothetical protein
MGTTGQEICHQNVSEILDIVYRLGPEFATMIWGPPGIGKTEATKAIFSREEDPHEIVLVLAGCSEPTDISGVPFEYKHKGEAVATRILAPIWAYHASTEAPPEYLKKKMVIFFDDIVTGHEQTQAACFKVFGEKKVGNLQLRDNVYIIAAGNRVEDKSAAFEMPMALANRMKHYYAKTDVDSWLEWAVNSHINPLITAFIRRQPQNLNTFADVVKLASAEKAFATPRTWEMMSKAMYKMDPKGGIQGDWLYKTAVGCIGSGIGIEFSAFANNTTKLIAPEDIIKDPAKAPIPPKTEVDVLYATISALEHHINIEENWCKWDKALQYVLRPELESEFGLLIAKMATIIALSKLSEEDRVKAAQNKWFKEMYTKYGSYLANSGA